MQNNLDVQCADLVCEMKGLFQTHRPRCRSLVNRPGSSNRETALKWAGKVLPDECNLKDIVMCMTLYDIVRMVAEGSQHSLTHRPQWGAPGAC